MIVLRKGLNITQLKIIALIFMIIDHICFFFPFLDIPIWFRYIGRLSLPIFIFAITEGYYYTKDKKKYITRLLISSIIMFIINYIINLIMPRPDGFILKNNIFATLFFIVFYIYCMDNINLNRKNLKCLLYLLMFLLTLPITFFIEAGTVFIFLGVFMYYSRNKRYLQIFIYCCFSILFLNSYQIYMIFAAPLFYLYNGHKRKGLKYLFYVFYPVHIYIFYIISYFILKGVN